MAPTVGIKHFTYSDFNNNYVYNIKEISGIDNILGSGICAATRGSFTDLQASGSSYLRPITPPVQGIYLGQASTTSSGIEMTATGDTTIDFSTPAINYKGRIQYNNSTNALSFFTNSSATASLVLTDSTTTNKIICNNFEPTTVNTDMIIKANTVLFGDTLTHTSLSGSSSNFYS